MNLEFRVIPHRVDSASLSLAIDASLLASMDAQVASGKKVKPIFRTFQFSRPVVIMGYNQSVEGRFNTKLAESMGVELTRRNTGGGHMYYSPDDLHFSFIAPKNYFGGGDLIANYQKINSFALKALQKSGYNAVLGRTSLRILDGKEKFIAGTAQRLSANALLHQGGILVSPYNDDIFNVLMARVDEIDAWKEQVTSLVEQGKNYDKLGEHMLAQLPKYETKGLGVKELYQASKLMNEVYRNPEFISTGNFEQDICLISGDRSNKNRMESVQYA